MGRSIRVASVADAAVVAELLDRFNREYDTPSPGPAVLAGRLERLLTGGQAVALLAGEPPVGVALLTLRPNVWSEGPVTLLDELYVIPSERRKGAGTALLKAAEAECRRRGSELLEINVDGQDTEARRFYERHGYVNREPGQQEPELYYHRDLLPPSPAVRDPNDVAAYDDLESRAIGGPRPLSGPIELREYDDRWPDCYAGHAARVRTALGERALRIEHVGSTSVPGLVAKPIIDIVLEVTDTTDEPAYVADLEGAGYVLRIREPEWFEHRLFKTAVQDVNLHVFSAGCPETERMVRFRDWLRSNQDDRELYGRAKRELAARSWKYMQQYADAKTDVVEQIMTRAMPAS